MSILSIGVSGLSSSASVACGGSPFLGRTSIEKELGTSRLFCFASRAIDPHFIQLRNKIVQQLSDLSAQRTRAHFDALVGVQLDPEAVDRYFIHHGLGRGENALWALAGLGGDVLALQSFFPYLTWVGNPGLELSLAKVESDIKLLFAALQRFEAGVGSDK